MKGGFFTKKRVASLQDKLGLTAAQLADVVGVHMVTLYRWRCYGGRIVGRPHDLLVLLEKSPTKEFGDKLAAAMVTKGALGALHVLLSREFGS